MARELYRSNDIKYLLECIGRSAPGSIRRFVPNVKKQELPPVFSDISVVPLHSTALLTYLRERKIDTNVARNECVEVHYACNCKRYYAIGFRNRSGGYELRNRWFKGCIAPKDISHIRQEGDNENKNCLVFEGFIDYLSFRTLRKYGSLSCFDAMESDFIVLNSVSSICKALPLLREYDKTVCLLDNDSAGRNAFASLSRALNGNAEDMSSQYNGFKDLNELIQ
ncbi:MAG TPA: toprim domain-containing protein, partial [Candidatus Prevotella stercoripullorum]|nr:toprim domain-containing protein [Candidatus Prevotella stercoripullorum]